jgi:hypothetical protein
MHLDMPQNVQVPFEIGTLGAFFEPTPEREADLTGQQVRLIKELISVLDKQLLAVVNVRSKDDFRKVRDVVFPKYIRAIRALQDTMSNLDDSSDHDTAAILSELTADLQKQTTRFGSAMTEQSLFTLWTIGKIRSLAGKIDALPDSNRDKNRELFHEYRLFSLWAQFHLDILFNAVKFDRPVSEELHEIICDGLKAAVNAYVIMKEALRLRQPRTDEPSAVLPWDDEDERLLAASMRDVNADFSDDH